MSVSPTRDLRSTLGGARDQGPRQTCCAFACSDAHAAIRPPWTELSTEYAHFHGARRQGTGREHGVHLPVMMDVLRLDGQPREQAWPYSHSPFVQSGPWAPPADVGQLFRVAGDHKASDDLRAVRAVIDAGQPVVMVLTISDAFVFSAVDGDGVIDSAEPPDPTRVHAVVAVAHGVRGGDAVTLVRNSWGASWGMDGHAWLTDRYLQPRLREWAALRKVI